MEVFRSPSIVAGRIHRLQSADSGWRMGGGWELAVAGWVLRVERAEHLSALEEVEQVPRLHGAQSSCGGLFDDFQSVGDHQAFDIGSFRPKHGGRFVQEKPK